MKSVVLALTIFHLGFFSNAVFAIPNLQLGAGSQGTWAYDTGSDTWITSSSPFSIVVTALPTAWDDTGAANDKRYAYLVLASVPQTNEDNFDVTVGGAVGGSGPVTSGFGKPPLEDPNDLSPHGIFDTYFEIYEFQFDGSLQPIGNTEPGNEGDSAQGYLEEIAIAFDGTPSTGLHLDLFTVAGDGWYEPGTDEDKKLVKANAPFSHDAEFELTHTPEPGTLLLLASGLVGLGVWRWRGRRARIR